MFVIASAAYSTEWDAVVGAVAVIVVADAVDVDADVGEIVAVVDAVLNSIRNDLMTLKSCF